ISTRLVDWSMRTGLPEVSPFFAIAINVVTLDARRLYALIVVVLGAAIAIVSTVTRPNVDRSPAASQPPRRAPLVHEHTALIVLCIFAVLRENVALIWQLLARNVNYQFDWTSAPLFWRSAEETWQ